MRTIYVEFDKKNARFKMPAKVFDEKPEDTDVIKITLQEDEIFDLSEYEIVKMKNNQYKAVKKEDRK